MLGLPEGKKTFYYVWRYGSQAIWAYLGYAIFRCMPLSWASGFGGWLLEKLGPSFGKTRQVVLPNLDLAFPEKGAVEKDTIMRGMWNNLGRVICEYAHLYRIADNIEIMGGQYLDAVRDSGRPAIFFAGHIANWEISAIGVKKHGIPIHLVYRKPNNPWVDNLIRYVRSSGASGHIEKGSTGARQILSVIKNNGAVGMLIDQKMTTGGIPVPFFGKPAMTVQAMATFALKFDVPLYPVQVIRLKGARFRMIVHPPLQIEKTGDAAADTLKIMTDANAMLESWICAHPAQWMWTHKRWKI